MIYNLEQAWEMAISILIASMGGLARILYMKDTIVMTWARLLSELFVSGFCGIMALLFMRASGFYGDWVGVVCGMAGWIGPEFLDSFAEKVEKVVGIKVSPSVDVRTDDEAKDQDARK